MNNKIKYYEDIINNANDEIKQAEKEIYKLIIKNKQRNREKILSRINMRQKRWIGNMRNRLKWLINYLKDNWLITENTYNKTLSINNM